MKYCEQCGTELKEDEIFCSECGAKQAEEQMITKRKHKRPNILTFIIVSITFGIIVAYFALNKSPESKPELVTMAVTENTVEETTSMEESSVFVDEWKYDGAKIESFKKLFLNSYPSKTIGDALVNYDVSDWKFKEEDGKKYLRCEFTYENVPYCFVFYVDEYDNVNIAELLIRGEKQGKDKLVEISELLFKKEEPTDALFSESRIGYFSNGYWAMDVKSIDYATNTIIYDGYEYAFSEIEPACRNQTGVIIDANTLDIYGVTIHWEGDGFTITNGEDAMIMSSMAGSSHDVEHGAGEYKRVEKPQPSITQENPNNLTTYFPVVGDYNTGYIGEVSTIRISKVDDKSFVFSIYKYYEGEGEKLIFREHVATFEGDVPMAVYRGNEYTLYFDCSSYGTITLYGFEEVGEGTQFWNSYLLRSS